MLKEKTERLLEKSGRITPRQVLEAYEQSGLKPIQGFQYLGGAGCAVGALMAADGFDFEEYTFQNSELRIEARDKFGGREYAVWFEAGFDSGFDSMEYDLSPETMSRARKGWRDGQRAYRAVESRIGVLS